MASKPGRRNLVGSTAENFKPPIFKPNTTLRNRIENWLRRLLDLQAGSVWMDLKCELSQAQGNLLDIGCGAQIYRGLIPAEVSYFGIDTSESKAHFGYQVPDTRYFDAGGDWGVEDGAFNVALATEVLEHIDDPSAFLARAHRCLRPGGRLVMTVPFAVRWHFIPYDYWRYTPSGLDLLLRSAGFHDVRVLARGNPTTVACYKIMALQLALLFGSDSGSPRILMRALGFVLLPVLLMLACIANLSMRQDWGDDCLGYTVTARRPAKT